MHLPILSTIAIGFTAFAAFTSADCIQDQAASKLATAFGTLISAYNKTIADTIIAPNFIDYSESINSLKNGGCTGPTPLTGPTFTSRATFESESAAQPALPFKILNYWFNCNNVIVRWQSDQSPQPVIGISVLQVIPASTSYKWAINEIWVEFDSAAWLVNLGIFKPSCSSSKREEKWIA